MLRFRVYQNQTKNTAMSGKFYGRLTHESMSYQKFIQYMMSKRPSYSASTAKNVIEDVKDCLRELLLDGKAVKVDGLGTLSLGAKTTPAETAKDVDSEHRTGFHLANIVALHLNWFLADTFKASQLFKDAEFKEADKYTPDDGDGGDDGSDKADTKDNTDNGDNSGSGSGASSGSGNDGDDDMSGGIE